MLCRESLDDENDGSIRATSVGLLSSIVAVLMGESAMIRI
jgi:hypothetical protein